MRQTNTMKLAEKLAGTLNLCLTETDYLLSSLQTQIEFSTLQCLNF